MSEKTTEASPTASAPASRPPAFISGGKRLNFDRADPWEEGLSETFTGYGKDEGQKGVTDMRPW